MFGGSLVIVEALAHMTPNDTKPMTAIGRTRHSASTWSATKTVLLQGEERNRTKN